MRPDLRQYKHWDLRFGTPVVPAERHTQLLPS